MATSYSVVKTDVQYYSDRSDIDSTDYDRFFRKACEIMNRKLRVPEMETSVDVAGSSFPYTDTNNDIMEVTNVYCTRSSRAYRLDFVSYQTIKDLQAQGGTGSPTYFSTLGKVFAVAPTPASTDTITITYYARQDDTLADNETNAFVSFYDSIVVELMLAELYKALHDSQRFSEHSQMAMALINEANTAGWNRRNSARMQIREN